MVFTKDGLDKSVPDLLPSKELAAMNRAVNSDTGPRPVGDYLFSDTSDYAEYLRAVAMIKALLTPRPYKENLHPRDTTASFNMKGIDRLKEVEARLGGLGALRDCDRVDIANLLVEHNHVNGSPELFVRLTTEKPVLSDLIDCRDAFIIGRQLFLLGFHEPAYRYLELAFLRHPFNTEYEIWYQIIREKLQKPPIPFCSPPDHEPALYLYYRTLADMRSGKSQRARKRLEQALEKDSHDSLAAHLMSKYFGRPLNERHYFPAQEGL